MRYDNQCTPGERCNIVPVRGKNQFEFDTTDLSAGHYADPSRRSGWLKGGSKLALQLDV